MSARSDIRTDPLSTRRVLLFAAHSSDEFSVAATLRAHVARGESVFISWYARDDRPDVGVRRAAEAREAAALIGIPSERLEFADLSPVALLEQLPALVLALRDTVARVAPDLVYVPAFEGGHPDHDALNFAAFEAASSTGIETREFPLYSASPDRRFFRRLQSFARFIPGAGDTQVRRLNPAEVRFKRELWALYRTQHPHFDRLVRRSGDEREFFTTEKTRPLPLRDYTKPPHERPLLYELQAGELPYTFEEFADKVRHYLWTGGLPDDDVSGEL